MGKLFGTDGVRGIAGKELTPELATLVGRAAAAVLAKTTKHRPKVIIGKDTRISGDMLECALAAGLCSVGADVELLGVLPTPAVAYLVKHYGADAGVVISASHNPVEFNGIKLFNGNGMKLADDIELEIENIVLEGAGALRLATGGDVGRVFTKSTAVEDYVAHVVSSGKFDLRGMKVGIDCGNGAASETAKQLFTQLGADCFFIGTAPDGCNINDGCGSTHLETLSNFVVKNGLHCGIAFDGDADRCLAVDEHGQTLDGDKIISALAIDLKAQNKLDKNTAVLTVMSNLGCLEYLKNNGINIVATAVGDRYVLEEMTQNGYILGGEQSGHVILLEHATTGDGQLTAAFLLNILAKSNKKMSQLGGAYNLFPQMLVNIEATAAQKAAFKQDEYLEGFIESEQQKLIGVGRILVRVSGTEPLIRVMVEGRDEEIIKECAERVVQKINSRI